MAKRLPTLSSSGYLQGLNDQADRLMAYYLSADRYQSELYADNIGSFQGRLSQYTPRYQALVEQIETDLTGIYQRQFDDAQVQVNFTPMEGDRNQVSINIEVTLTDQGRRYNLGRLIEVIESKVINIMDITQGKAS